MTVRITVRYFLRNFRYEIEKGLRAVYIYPSRLSAQLTFTSNASLQLVIFSKWTPCID